MTDYLDEIQARADAATPGPWRWRNSNLDPMLVGARTLVVMAFRRMGFSGAQPVFRDHERDVLVDAGRENINAFPDAVFIAHARTDVPRLVAEVRDLTRLLDAAREDKIKARRQRSEYRLRAMRAEAALRAVEALHSRTRRRSGFNLRVCEECGYVAPCRTVTAIRDAIRDALDPT